MGFFSRLFGRGQHSADECLKQADACLADGEYDQAMDSYNRGVEALENGDYDVAITCYTEAIRLDPELPEAYEGRAKAYRALGNEKKADDDERKAQELTR